MIGPNWRNCYHVANFAENAHRDLLVFVIKILRNAIREHRDQRGDDRCWLDDYLLWSYLPDSIQLARPNYDQGMLRCVEFFCFRNANTPDPMPENAILDPANWDDDLLHPQASLEQILIETHEAIRAHRDLPAGTIRRAEHDRILYSALPERIPADFRLPPQERFLETSPNPNESCPRFWASHANCEPVSCNLHRWGPCPKTRAA